MTGQFFDNTQTPSINMYTKLIALPVFFAAVSAGYVGAPLASSVIAPASLGYGSYGHGYGYPLATSYANTYKVSKSVPVIRTVAAPVGVVKSPLYSGYGLGYGNGIGYSNLGYGNGIGYSNLGYGNGLGYGHGLGYGNGLGYGQGLYY